MNDNSQKSLVYCSLLALQFGLQPILSNKFTAPGASKTSLVIATEVAKIVIALFSILRGPKEEIEQIKKNWSLMDSIKIAALPATLYAIQNLLVQHGYIYLDSMTFNLLNQTKTLSAAFWLWAILGKKQSGVQMIALLLLLIAAVVLNMNGSGAATPSLESTNTGYELGLLCVAVASLLSGLSAALTQRAVTGTNANTRNTMLLSAEMAVYGIVFLLLNLLFNSDIQADTAASGGHLLSHWDLPTLIPVITNAFGGVVVGLVTKYAGGVVKGFALIAGILVTGVAQFILNGKPLGAKDLAGMVLVSAAIFLHSKYPYQDKPTPATAPDKSTKRD